MGELHVGMAGVDMTPRFHPKFGAWGTSPTLTELDLPLLARCVALEEDGRRLVWYSMDLVGFRVPQMDELRDEFAEELGLKRDQLVISTSQTHSCGAFPGCNLTGSSLVDDSQQDAEFAAEERKRVMKLMFDAGRQAIDSLQPANVFAGRGFCDSMSYNTRFPMPGGGDKFSRHHAEGLQSGKYYDPVIGLVRFEDKQGKPLGAIFNFTCHPATMIMNKVISPDWVGTARQHVEDAIGGAPTMFIQGFCGDVNCHHIFGSTELAKRSGTRLGTAAAETMRNLIPARATPLHWCWREIELQCRPMYEMEEVEHRLALRQAFVDELDHDPQAVWFDGIDSPIQMTVDERKAGARMQMEHFKLAKQMIERGESAPSTLEFRSGALRIGDVGAVLSPGEQFAAAALKVRLRSPFVHTLVCGDTNGLFGYLGDDAEIKRGGYETDTFWKALYFEGGKLRLNPTLGTADRIDQSTYEMLHDLRSR
jgi:hypothetical protein